ncbi:MAG: 16S rRNA (cytosine(1402)-N(4))-methyltransferase RsmH [Bacteroidales bacterium]|nr:16S rRNA (cytosine(1402)-N(4))-methyltransferase RsmH [Bacteroidales bacterium]
MAYHVPALLEESIDGLNIKPSGIYVDVTFGGGGHSKEILKALGPDGKLIAFDRDEESAKNVPDDKRITFLNQNFRFLKNNLKFNGVEQIDGLLADLGVSFHQFDDASRGFSFRMDCDLDMRMNRDASIDASYLVNNMDEDSLADIFYSYGELQASKQIAKAIVDARSKKAIKTANDLMDVLQKFAPFGKENKFYAKVFQALRIEVNGEIKALKEMLTQSLDVLKSKGRLVVITYHSLEDRLVKNFMRTGNFEGELEKDFYGNVKTPFYVENKKGVVPSDEEIARNNRARSARLRVAEKN